MDQKLDPTFLTQTAFADMGIIDGMSGAASGADDVDLGHDGVLLAFGGNIPILVEVPYWDVGFNLVDLGCHTKTITIRNYHVLNLPCLRMECGVVPK